jgi:hypothetical protein
MQACLAYPAQVILHYFATNSSHGQYRTKHGTCDAVKRLAAKADRVVTSCTVTDVWRADASTGQPARVRYSQKVRTFVVAHDCCRGVVRSDHLLSARSHILSARSHLLFARSHVLSARSHVLSARCWWCICMYTLTLTPNRGWTVCVAN